MCPTTSASAQVAPRSVCCSPPTSVANGSAALLALDGTELWLVGTTSLAAADVIATADIAAAAAEALAAPAAAAGPLVPAAVTRCTLRPAAGGAMIRGRMGFGAGAYGQRIVLFGGEVRVDADTLQLTSDLVVIDTGTPSLLARTTLTLPSLSDAETIRLAPVVGVRSHSRVFLIRH
jgi:hypothetical protein